MENLKLCIERVKAPSPKVLLMYQAVSELFREKKDLRDITVSEITKKAGIGKGTAYEYFSSKEELIASALVHEYGMKLKKLADMVQRPGDFRQRCYKIMDWLMDNREYNIMFSHILKNSSADSAGGEALCQSVPKDLFAEIQKFIYGEIDRFMESGYETGAFTEQNITKRRLAFLSAMVQYAFVIMAPLSYGKLDLTDEELREFVYQGMIKALCE